MSKIKDALLKEQDELLESTLGFYEWLEKNIHQHGCRYSTDELVERATGKKPSAEDYTAYLKEKFTKLYDL